MKKENIIITVNSCGRRKSATFLQHLKKLSEEYTIVLNIKKEENTKQSNTKYNNHYK